MISNKMKIGLAAAGGLGLLLLASTSSAAPSPSPSPPSPGPPGPPGTDPPGPNPPSTWGGLSQAIVTDSQGVLARTGPGTNNPIGPGGGVDASTNRDPNHNMAPWPGARVAVLQTGLQGAGASEWWKIYTPGGYPLYVAAVTLAGKSLFQHDPNTPALPGAMASGGGSPPVLEQMAGLPNGWYPYRTPARPAQAARGMGYNPFMRPRGR